MFFETESMEARMSDAYPSTSVTFHKRFLSMLDRALFSEDTSKIEIGICDYLRAYETTRVQKHEKMDCAIRRGLQATNR